jgi:hypothetical protein
MYNISDIVEMGQAHELVLSLIKELPFTFDDDQPQTMPIEEHFDE